jgi:hypothetical protein
VASVTACRKKIAAQVGQSSKLGTEVPPPLGNKMCFVHDEALKSSDSRGIEQRLTE